ncbi:hypothetical protein GYMLUDRAFT_32642 [Collybiopsis luxurians FD-317 M1]|nr:hypothetical protein GYMLUDRAFT_32642 [Collybiopsis luxurians FD-317 M1]
MKSTIYASSFASLSILFTTVKAQSSLTLWALLPTDTSDGDSFTIPTPTAWVNPLGTAADGSETTFLYNEVDSGDAGLFGDVQSGTTVVTTSFTMIASASGIRIPNLDSVSAECTLESPNTGGCVYVAAADVGDTSLVTVTETGLPVSFFEVPISSNSGVPSSTDSSSGSSTPSSGSSTSSSTGGAHNGSQSVQRYAPHYLGLVVAGLWIGASLVV